jgi:hypothetical protein
MDYTTLSLTAIGDALEDVARETTLTFAPLDARQLNWRPDPTRWSVAQCFEHLVTSNRLMRQQAEAALDPRMPRSLWQRLPVVPGLLGPVMVRSLAPQPSRKFKAPAAAVPTTSDIPPEILQRFVDQQRELAQWVRTLDDERAHVTMISPFAKVISYSVHDGLRIIVTHNRRHVEQARRVTEAPGFPRDSVHAKA